MIYAFRMFAHYKMHCVKVWNVKKYVMFSMIEKDILLLKSKILGPSIKTLYPFPLISLILYTSRSYQ